MNTRILSTCSLLAALSASALTPLSAADQDARPVSQIAPAYSHDLRADGVEGEVVIGFTISAKGDVINPRVIRTTDSELDRATLAAVRQWKFSPAMKDGVAVSVQAVQPVAFVIPALHDYASVRFVAAKPAAVSSKTAGL
jgi:protein TonB